MHMHVVALAGVDVMCLWVWVCMWSAWVCLRVGECYVAVVDIIVCWAGTLACGCGRWCTCGYREWMQ